MKKLLTILFFIPLFCFSQCNINKFDLNLMHKDFDYVHKLWNEKLQPYEDGYFDPYYDGLLYMFSLMHLSGKYQVITPAK